MAEGNYGTQAKVHEKYFEPNRFQVGYFKSSQVPKTKLPIRVEDVSGDVYDISGFTAHRVVGLLSQIVNSERWWTANKTFYLVIHSQSSPGRCDVYRLTGNPTAHQPGNGSIGMLARIGDEGPSSQTTSTREFEELKYVDLINALNEQYKDKLQPSRLDYPQNIEVAKFANDMMRLFQNNGSISGVPAAAAQAYMLLLFEIARRMVQKQKTAEARKLGELPIGCAIARALEILQDGTYEFRDLFLPGEKFHCFSGEAELREEKICNISREFAQPISDECRFLQRMFGWPDTVTAVEAAAAEAAEKLRDARKEKEGTIKAAHNYDLVTASLAAAAARNAGAKAEVAACRAVEITRRLEQTAKQTPGQKMAASRRAVKRAQDAKPKAATAKKDAEMAREMSNAAEKTARALRDNLKSLVNEAGAACEVAEEEEIRATVVKKEAEDAYRQDPTAASMAKCATLADKAGVMAGEAAGTALKAAKRLEQAAERAAKKLEELAKIAETTRTDAKIARELSDRATKAALIAGDYAQATRHLKTAAENAGAARKTAQRSRKLKGAKESDVEGSDGVDDESNVSDQDSEYIFISESSTSDESSDTDIQTRRPEHKESSVPQRKGTTSATTERKGKRGASQTKP